MVSEHQLAAEAWTAAERDRLRRSALERLAKALQAHQDDPHNWRWREVLTALRDVEATER